MTTILIAVSQAGVIPDSDKFPEYLGTIEKYRDVAYEYAVDYGTCYFTVGDNIFTGYLFEGSVSPDPLPNKVHLVITDLEGNEDSFRFVKRVTEIVKEVIDAHEVIKYGNNDKTRTAISFAGYDPRLLNKIRPIKTIH